MNHAHLPIDQESLNQVAGFLAPYYGVTTEEKKNQIKGFIRTSLNDAFRGAWGGFDVALVNQEWRVYLGNHMLGSNSVILNPEKPLLPISKRKTIAEFEILDHGVDHAQYFPGCGVSFTKFDDVATGVGNTPAEAFQGAIDILMENNWDVSTIEESEEVNGFRENKLWDTVPQSIDEQDEMGELYYYISVRVR